MNEQKNGGLWLPVLALFISTTVELIGATVYITNRFSALSERQATLESRQTAQEARISTLYSTGTDFARKDHDDVVILKENIGQIRGSLVRLEIDNESAHKAIMEKMGVISKN